MKKKIFALLLVGVLCFSLTACGDSDVKTVLDSSDAETNPDTAAETDTATSFTESADETDEEIDIPDAIKNISPEDDKALTGILTEDSYINEYFGLKLNKVEGGAIDSLMDEGTDLPLLSESYEDGLCAIIIDSHSMDNMTMISLMISATSSVDQGKTEEELAQERSELDKRINESIEVEAEYSVENINIAGEERPTSILIEDSENGKTKAANTYIIKGDFECSITIYTAVEDFDEAVKLIEKY